MKILDKSFYSIDALSLSKKLLGKVLVNQVNGKVLKGLIVETEAYIGAIDKASHAYGGRRTERTETLYGEPGIVYVYSIYGMYFCFNVICGEKDVAEGVLIRGLEPLEGFEEMSFNRFKKPYEELTKSQIKNLTNGPSKLCIAMNINKSNNKEKLIKENSLYIEDHDIEVLPSNIVETKRIGIDYAEEAVHFPWRFYIKDNPYVSKK
ncbi:MAG: DNA-3-methyladenine glycosylase [Clostridium sp.]|nr:DNA-3-methyladenine glycosylase [Clostridium sp.]